jgi:glutaredoxin
MSAERFESEDREQVASPLLEYVTTPACSDCRRFEDLLARVQPDFPSVEFREVRGESTRGLEISVERGILRFPIILLDDQLLAVETITESELRQALLRRVVL